MMWAMIIVSIPRVSRSDTNSASIDTPSTISGDAIGMKMNRLSAERPRKRKRVSASAIRVPSTVATSVLTAAAMSEFLSASVSSGKSSSRVYHLNVKPSHEKLSRPL